MMINRKKAASAIQLRKLMEVYPPGYCSLLDKRPEMPRIYDVCIVCEEEIEITDCGYFEAKPYGPFECNFLGTGDGNLELCPLCPQDEKCFCHSDCMKWTTDCCDCAYCDDCIIKVKCGSCHQPFGSLDNLHTDEDGHYVFCLNCHVKGEDYFKDDDDDDDDDD